MLENLVIDVWDIEDELGINWREFNSVFGSDIGVLMCCFQASLNFQIKRAGFWIRVLCLGDIFFSGTRGYLAMASMRHGYMFLRHLQSKATAATDIARCSTAFYKQLMEENAHRVVDPPRVQHCQILCMRLLHARNHSSSAVKGLQKAGLPEPREEAKEMPGNWVVKGLVLAMLTYIGMNVAPMMGENMVRHSVSLVKVKDPFMKRSGASRLTMIATDDEKRKRILDAGGVKALMGMLETASDDDTRREALTTLATLAHYDPAVDAMHNAGGLPLVNALSESATDSIIQEHCSALLAKLDQRAINKA